jgi:hypothetical protein
MQSRGITSGKAMTAKRDEPFAVALENLRGRLRRGDFGYERRLAATEIAEQLRLSPTPVREALARLAGEGLLEDRRGQGFFVPRPGAVDVADLYRLNQAHLLIALEPRAVSGAPLPPAPEEGEPPTDPLAAVDALFDGWVRAAGSWTLLQAHRRVQARLGPVRRREQLVFADLEGEAEALSAGAGDPPRAISAVRLFHRRRIRIADRLAGLLETRPGPAQL